MTVKYCRILWQPGLCQRTMQRGTLGNYSVFLAHVGTCGHASALYKRQRTMRRCGIWLFQGAVVASVRWPITLLQQGSRRTETNWRTWCLAGHVDELDVKLLACVHLLAHLSVFLICLNNGPSISHHEHTGPTRGNHCVCVCVGSFC